MSFIRFLTVFDHDRCLYKNVPLNRELHILSYKQLDLRPPSLRSLKITTTLSATFELQFSSILSILFHLSLHLNLKLSNNLATLSFDIQNTEQLQCKFEPHFGHFDNNSTLNSKIGLLMKNV